MLIPLGKEKERTLEYYKKYYCKKLKPERQHNSTKYNGYAFEKGRYTTKYTSHKHIQFTGNSL